MSSRRGLNLLALLAPPVVVGLALLLASESFLRWQRFGVDGLTQPLLYMAPAWRDTDCFEKGPNQELMTPNCRMQYKGVAVETNSAGLNDREVDESRPHYRVVLLGDSVSMAAGVAPRDIYHAVLEERLNSDLGSPGFVEIYNYGRGGRSTVDEVADFQAALARWPLDAALVAVTPGNIWANLLNPTSCELDAPDQTLSDAQLQFYSKRVKGENFISNVLIVAERTTGLWSFHVPRDFFRSITQRLNTSDQDGDRIAALEDLAVAKFVSCSRRMRQIADEAGVQLAWIVLWYVPNRHAEIVRHELDQLGEPVTTTMGVHKQYASTEEMIIYPREVHPNAAVHRSFADELRPWLGEIGWIERIEAAHRERLGGIATAAGN